MNFDPTLGAVIRKTRPALVISSDAVGVLPVKLVAPLTEWRDSYSRNIWHVRIDPDYSNGLSKPSAVDVLQVRSMVVERFQSLVGRLRAPHVEEVVAALAAAVEYR